MVARASGLGLLDKSLLSILEAAEEVALFIGSVNAIVAGNGEVIRVDVVIALATSEAVAIISVASPTVALIISALFRVTMSDLVVSAVAVAFVTICRAVLRAA